ncbi:hypothetical protein [Burkholderia cenocepacia]|nr:hypothetical protein [Burkholderia cenocepacia]
MELDRALDADKGVTMDEDIRRAAGMERLGVHRAAAPRVLPFRWQ